MAASGSMERTLGIIIGKLEGIDERLTRQDESRAKLHGRVDDLVVRTTHMESDVSSLKHKVEGMEKVTVQTTTLITKAEGAGTLGRWLIRLGIGVVTVAGWLIGAYTYVTGRPPP